MNWFREFSEASYQWAMAKEEARYWREMFETGRLEKEVLQAELKQQRDQAHKVMEALEEIADVYLRTVHRRLVSQESGPGEP